jgi:hypothetical protein
MDWVDSGEESLKYVNLVPRRAFHTSGVLKGEKQNVSDLPVTRYKLNNGQVVTASYYQVSFLDRVKFLFCGRIFVSLYGKTHQPCSVGIGELFKKGKKT